MRWSVQLVGDHGGTESEVGQAGFQTSVFRCRSVFVAVRLTTMAAGAKSVGRNDTVRRSGLSSESKSVYRRAKGVDAAIRDGSVGGGGVFLGTRREIRDFHWHRACEGERGGHGGVFWVSERREVERLLSW